MGDRLNEYSWYHGSLPRVACESILNQDRPGLFLVRDSSSIPNGYVLSVKEVQKVSHYIINFNEQSRLYKIGDQTFDDLPSIVEFYKKHFLDTTTLVEPVSSHVTSANPLKVRAKFNFAGNDPEDLSFKKGDVLIIIKKEEEDWWLARHPNGQEGLIPRTYIEELPQGGIAPSPTHSYQNDSRRSFPASRPQDSQATSRLSTGGKDYMQPKVFPMKVSQEPSISMLPAGPVLARAKQSRDPSFYDQTQLKFKKDDQIRVLKRNDDGIWEGENLENGSKGLFPFTFVEILKDQS
eukprot:gene16800-18496_t